MFRLVSQATTYNAHAPYDPAPDGFGGSGIGTILHRTLNVMKAVYSFAVNGGAVSSIALLDDLGNPAVVPPNAVIFESFSNWTTAMQGSNNCSISIAAAAAADLKTSTAKSSFTGLLAGTPVATTATAVSLGSTAAGYQLYLDVLTSAITAGIGNIYLWYVL